MEEAKDLVQRLDAMISREGAKVRMTQYGGGPNESRIAANERGYLRLGIEFMKLAYADKEEAGSETLILKPIT